jgi:hypothetical protein
MIELNDGKAPFSVVAAAIRQTHERTFVQAVGLCPLSTHSGHCRVTIADVGKLGRVAKLGSKIPA